VLGTGLVASGRRQTLTDGWQETFPTTKTYTYHQMYTGSQSRLDRFYVKHDLIAHTYEGMCQRRHTHTQTRGVQCLRCTSVARVERDTPFSRKRERIHRDHRCRRSDPILLLASSLFLSFSSRSAGHHGRHPPACKCPRPLGTMESGNLMRLLG
jgi:hypothetical protein